MNAAFESYEHFFTAPRIDGKPLMMRRGGLLRPVMFKAYTPSLAILNDNESQSSLVIDNNAFVLSSSAEVRESHFACWKMPPRSTYSIVLSWSFSAPPEGENYFFGSTMASIAPQVLDGVPAANIKDSEYQFYSARVNDVERVIPPPKTYTAGLGIASMSVGGTDSLELVHDGGVITTNYIEGDGYGLPLQGSASITNLPLPYLRGGLDIRSPLVSGVGTVSIRISFSAPE